MTDREKCPRCDGSIGCMACGWQPLASPTTDEITRLRARVEEMEGVATAALEHLEWHGEALGEEASETFPPPRWDSFTLWRKLCEAVGISEIDRMARALTDQGRDDG